ncbi:MAG: hypothetical protein OXE41_04940 [Gammaproteobacteria bacterium]|nr:hypothetical protein [Gammaproteobacteria bacterium]MCY4219477.1 hypothetical protein [Gammaproteobacteria bacterium]MCY4274726.1 hypothetical protein [Gammaproteobacteria bacterium]
MGPSENNWLSLREKAKLVQHYSRMIDRPTDWRPGQVRNPNGILDDYFTEAAAWEFIATNIESGHCVEVVELKKPAGAKGYVMKIDIEPEVPKLYIKLQLGSGKIIGRSFHYSKH